MAPRKKRKPLEDMTAEEVMEKVFNKKVVRELNKIVQEQDDRATKRYDRKKSKSH